MMLKSLTKPKHWWSSAHSWRKLPCRPQVDSRLEVNKSIASCRVHKAERICLTAKSEPVRPVGEPVPVHSPIQQRHALEIVGSPMTRQLPVCFFNYGCRHPFV